MPIRPICWSWTPIPFPSINGTGRAHQSLAGETLPESLEDIFSDESIQTAIMSVERVKRLLEKARQSWNPHIAPKIIDLLEEATALMTGSIPWSVCGDCGGVVSTNGEACAACMGCGWVPLMMRGMR